MVKNKSKMPELIYVEVVGFDKDGVAYADLTKLIEEDGLEAGDLVAVYHLEKIGKYQPNPTIDVE